jgi:SAM-dependent methyltransferase
MPVTTDDVCRNPAPDRPTAGTARGGLTVADHGEDMQKLYREIVRKLPIIGARLIRSYKVLVAGRQVAFPRSAGYWEKRYRAGGTSGAGSYSRLAEFKAEIINEFVRAHNVASVIEFGCGDGAQLALAKYPQYVGLDVSPAAVEICKQKFASDATKRFYVVEYRPFLLKRYDLALSLDVIYHLVEDDVYENYMSDLFSSAYKYIIIYSSNKEKIWKASHVRHRAFERWVSENQPSWKLIKRVKNRYPYDASDKKNTSFADFYMYARIPECRSGRWNDGSPAGRL